MAIASAHWNRENDAKKLYFEKRTAHRKDGEVKRVFVSVNICGSACTCVLVCVHKSERRVLKIENEHQQTVTATKTCSIRLTLLYIYAHIRAFIRTVHSFPRYYRHRPLSCLCAIPLIRNSNSVS